MSEASVRNKAYRMTLQIPGTSRFKGWLCSKHPECEGVRYIANSRCVGCHREKMIAKKAKRRESPEFRAEEARKFKEYITIPAIRKRYANNRAIPENRERKNAVNRARLADPDVKSKHASRQRLRTAQCRRAMPPWADREKILAVYKEARRLGLTVDHQIPLNGVNVCGLHVHYNLGLATRSDNSAKGNRVGALSAF